MASSSLAVQYPAEYRVKGTLQSVQIPEDGHGTGNIWDLLALGGLLTRHHHQKAVLGWGGGTVAALIRSFQPYSVFDAVEVNRDAIDVAYSWGVDYQPPGLCPTDVTEWIFEEFKAHLQSGTSPSSRPYSLIIEDTFKGYEKPEGFPVPNYRMLSTLTDTLVVNTVGRAAPRTRAILKDLYPRVVKVELGGLLNRVFIASTLREECTGKALRAAASKHGCFQRILANNVRISLT